MAYINKEKLILDVQRNLIPGTDVDGTVNVEQAERHFINLINKHTVTDVVEVVRCINCGSYNELYGECTLDGAHFGKNGYCCKGTPKQKNDLKE